MELRQLQCMVICAQTKSFSKAASMLFTSQSNVSKTIAALEKELGKKIFERRRHGIELTAKGEQIYKFVTMTQAIRTDVTQIRVLQHSLHNIVTVRSDLNL